MRSHLFSVMLILTIPVSFTMELPHGVPFSMASFYRLGKPFSCIDGSASIPWTKVNDDYCDCMDGSDEPGTPACRRGIFYCKDVQYKLSSIPTAYVKDDFCDCCDGSDEFGGGATCDSNCGALAAAVQQAKSIKRAELEEGHKMFKQEVERLKIKRAKEEQERAAAEEAARIAAEAEAARHALHESDTVPTDNDADPQNVDSSEVGHNVSESSMAGNNDSSSVDEQSRATGAEERESEGDHLSEQDDNTPEIPDEPEPPSEPKDYGPEGIFQVLDDMEQCLEYSDQQYTYELCGLREVFQREGPDNAHKVSLGKWAGWGHSNEDSSDSNKYSAMRFTNGLYCWNGPSRSTKVIVQCGPANELISASEPSRCEYVMHLRTYAACFETPDVLFKRLHSDEL